MPKANVPDRVHEALSHPANLLEFAKAMQRMSNPATFDDPDYGTVELPIPGSGSTVSIRVLKYPEIKFNF